MKIINTIGIDIDQIEDRVEFRVQLFSQGSYDSRPACIEAMDPRFRQGQVRGWHGGDPNADGIGDLTLWEDFSARSGRSFRKFLPDNGLIDNFTGLMDRGRTIALNINSASASTPGHSILMKSVTRNTFQKVNGKVISKLSYQAMNPARGIVSNISRRSIMNAHKIFIFKPYTPCHGTSCSF